MRGLLANSALALESIQFQSGVFFRQLTTIFAGLGQEKPQGLEDSPLLAQLADCIQRNTGIVMPVTIGDYGPAVQLPQFDRNHPLWPDIIREYLNSADGMRLIQEAGGAVKGGVNLHTAQVTGVFCNLGSHMTLPVDFVLSKQFTPQEKAAVALHEIGHYFVFCEYVGRTVTTNYVLAGLTRGLDASQSEEEREVLISAASKALNIKDLDAKALAQTKSKDTIQGVVISGALRQVRSELGSEGYDVYGFEYLADEFAARQGASRALVTALDKFHRQYSHRSYRPLPLYLILEAMKFILLFSPGTVLAVLWMALDASSPVHEDPEARTRRVRNQIVEAMKDRKIPPSQFKALKDDLDAIDKILASITDRRQWITAIWETVIPGPRRQWQQQKLQKELENMAHNELFVKAQELKNLA